MKNYWVKNCFSTSKENDKKFFNEKCRYFSFAFTKGQKLFSNN